MNNWVVLRYNRATGQGALMATKLSQEDAEIEAARLGVEAFDKHTVFRYTAKEDNRAPRLGTVKHPWSDLSVKIPNTNCTWSI